LAVTQVYLMNENQPAMITLEPASGRDWWARHRQEAAGEHPCLPGL
jgi:hypothetical protein